MRPVHRQFTIAIAALTHFDDCVQHDEVIENI
jgi:hypothetical protein